MPFAGAFKAGGKDANYIASVGLCVEAGLHWLSVRGACSVYSLMECSCSIDNAPPFSSQVARGLINEEYLFNVEGLVKSRVLRA